MVKRHQRILDGLLVNSDLPCEPVPGVPLVELMNDQRVLIENHRGVTAYEKTEIRVQVKFGEIIVCGDLLEIACMSAKQLIIKGNIQSINISRGICK